MTDLVQAAAVVVDAELVDAGAHDVEELIDEWLDAGNKAAQTRTAYVSDVNSWLAWCARNRVDPLRARKVHTDSWIAEMTSTPSRITGKPPAKASAARRVSAVSSLYEYLVDQDYVEVFPVRASSRPKAPKKSTTVGLSAEETVQLRRQARESGTRDHAMTEVLVVEGLRVAELCDLPIRGYSWNKGRRTLIVVGKGEKRRELVAPPLTSAAIDTHLQDLAARLGFTGVHELDPDSPIFPSVAGGRLSQKAVLRTVQRLAKAARIPAWAKITPHSLRHTCATNMLDAGVPIHVVQDQLGHEDLSTTQRYDRSRGSLDRSGTGSYEQYLTQIELNMAGAA